VFGCNRQNAPVFVRHGTIGRPLSPWMKQACALGLKSPHSVLIAAVRSWP
jgi:hypothetical protein